MPIRFALMPVAVALTAVLPQTARNVLAQPTDVSAYVRYEYEMPSSVLSLNEPAIVHLAIENIGTDALVADFGGDFRDHFVVVVRTPNGQMTTRLQAKMDSDNQADILSATGVVLISPGERYVQTLILQHWHAFADVGLYQVQVHLPVPLRRVAAGAEVPPVEQIRATLPAISISRKQVFELEIGLRDPQRLQGVCEQLVASMTDARTRGLDEDATRALAVMVDPVAVPCMRRALTTQVPGRLYPHPQMDQLLIPTLARINTAEARSLLEDLARSSDEMRRHRANGYLRRLQNSSPPAAHR